VALTMAVILARPGELARVGRQRTVSRVGLAGSGSPALLPGSGAITAGTVTYGPAQSVNSDGFIAGTVENRQTPAAPSAGRWSTPPFATHVHPAGSVTMKVTAARRSGWSKQQKTCGAAVG
jgi:hypothetical protein